MQHNNETIPNTEDLRVHEFNLCRLATRLAELQGQDPDIDAILEGQPL